MMLMSGAALHLSHRYLCVASAEKLVIWSMTAHPNSLNLKGERNIHIFRGKEQNGHGDWENEGLGNLWARKIEKWSKVVNGEKKKHLLFYIRLTHECADRDQIEKATYPLPLPPESTGALVVLTWPESASLPVEAATGKTSVALKKVK